MITAGLWGIASLCRLIPHRNRDKKGPTGKPYYRNKTKKSKRKAQKAARRKNRN